MDLISAATLLFVTMDPLGNIPIFLSVLSKVEEKRRLIIVMRELFLALIVLFVFLFFGKPMLAALQLSQESVQVAGGIILFMIAVKMVFPVPRSAQIEEEIDGEPLLVPLAIPMIAGPSAIATLLILSNEFDGSSLQLSGAVVAAWLVTAIILLLATPLQRVLGRRGLVAMERLMGMLLVAISVQMFLDGLNRFLGH